MEIPRHPLSGSATNKYFTNDDSSVKVPALYVDENIYQQVRGDIDEYTWKDEDFLLTAYQKNGTHFMWEIMTMLLRGSADYIKDIKVACMIDLFPVSKIDAVFPSPRVLNTHYRLDVLPKEFRGKKTVLVIRNPKDSAVSLFHHDAKIMEELPQMKDVAKLTFSSHLKMFLFNKDLPYGSYFDYTEYMWSLRDDPNLLIVYFEDLKMDPVTNIQKVNEFMGTQRSPELVQQIADATKFNKMKDGKSANARFAPLLKEHFAGMMAGDQADANANNAYRKGEIGDWKNHLTVAENEMFDDFLEKWQPSKEIPFTY